MSDRTDSRLVIEEETPLLGNTEAVAIARDQFGLDVSVRGLVSERDQNFQMWTTDGRHYVLKIANRAEDPSVTDFQIEALLHIADYIESRGTPISVPKVLRARNGQTLTRIEIGDALHVARVVSYVEGIPIGDRVPSNRLCRDLGRYLAHLDNALRDFKHPGSHQKLLWDLQQALQLRELLAHIPDESVCREVAQSLDEFEEFSIPRFASLRRQVIHSDFNPDNVLTSVSQPDIVAGVIDFGDMLDAPLVADIAIAASYVRPKDGNPLALVAELVAGYSSVTPLQQNEIDILFELTKARLCASIAILYWRASIRDANDPYLKKLRSAESSAEVFLSRLRSIPRDHAIQTFRQVCASELRRSDHSHFSPP